MRGERAEQFGGSRTQVAELSCVRQSLALSLFGLLFSASPPRGCNDPLAQPLCVMLCETQPLPPRSLQANRRGRTCRGVSRMLHEAQYLPLQGSESVLQRHHSLCDRWGVQDPIGMAGVWCLVAPALAQVRQTRSPSLKGVKDKAAVS